MSRQRAGLLVKTGAALDADGFGDGDLDMVDMVAVPQRSKMPWQKRRTMMF